jgi:hypothetical protein
MAEELTFPKWYFSSQNVGGENYGGRLFETKEEFDAAGGQAVWKCTPQEAEAAALEPPVPPDPPPGGEDMGSTAPPRPPSRR